MLNRRQMLVFSGACALCCGRIDVFEASEAKAAEVVRGCVIRSFDSATGGNASDIKPIMHSGNPQMDALLGRSLLRLAKLFKINPGFGFYDDGENMNAFATAQSYFPDHTGTVLFGQNWFKLQLAADDNGLAVISCCAHEFGHIRQIATGQYDELLAGQPTVKLLELHADFLAGFFLADRTSEFPNLNLRGVGHVYEIKGDNNFTSPMHHGTADERIAAIEAGFFFGKNHPTAVIEEAQKAGATFVGRYS